MALTIRLPIRVSVVDNVMFAKAAAVDGVTVAQLIRSATRAAARRILERQTRAANAVRAAAVAAELLTR